MADLYSYNGVELPAPPDWDRTKFPYACVTVNALGEYRFILTATRPRFYRVWSNNVTAYYNSVVALIDYFVKYSVVEDNWVITTSGSRANVVIEYDYSTEQPKGSTLLWCNTNIYKVSDSSLYMAATEPVRIPPRVSTLAPAPMMMGWHAARRIVGMLQER